MIRSDRSTSSVACREHCRTAVRTSIRATNTCGTRITGDSAEATILLTPAVTATATGSTTVAVSWTSSGAGTTYDVFRASAGSPFDFAHPNPSGLTTLQFTDTVQTNRSYVYKVRATNGTATAMSLPDYATTIVFTDASITVGSTTIKAVHITELRSAVNLVAEAMGISDPYTAGELIASSLTGQTITSAGFVDVMTRLNGVRAQTAYGLPALSFVETPAPGVVIRKSHLVTLRTGVN